MEPQPTPKWDHLQCTRPPPFPLPFLKTGIMWLALPVELWQKTAANVARSPENRLTVWLSRIDNIGSQFPLDG